MPKAVTVYLCDPVTTEIKYTFCSMKLASEALGVSRQAVQDAVLKNHLVRGYSVIPTEAYDQIREN